MRDTFDNNDPSNPAMEKVEGVERYPQKRYKRIVSSGEKKQR
jgi:hypothetical protein